MKVFSSFAQLQRYSPEPYTLSGVIQADLSLKQYVRIGGWWKEVKEATSVTPTTEVDWGDIQGTLSNQTDLIAYLAATYYPLSNPNLYIDCASVPGCETDPVFTAWLSGPPNISEFNNDLGYITSAALSGYATQSWVNAQGFLTSITSWMVTTALGYTPYDASNPSGYITSSALSPYLTISSAAATYQPLGTYATATNSMTFSNKSGNISQWTNDSGYITSSSLSSYVQNSRKLSINGTQYDLSADRSWTVGDALTSGNLSQFAATTSAQLAGVISDETGTGALVFANTPTLTTPILGTPTSGNLTNCTSLPAASVNSGALANGMTATTQSAGDNSTKLATTAYADAVYPTIPYISGNWYCNGMKGTIITYSTSGSSTLAVNTLRAHPFIPSKTITLAKLGCMINTAANGKIRLIVWNDNGSLYPGTVLYDSGQLTAATAQFLSHTVTGTNTLTKGTIYWLGQVMDGVCNLPGYNNRLVVNELMGYQGLNGDTASYIGYTTTSANAFANGAPTFPAGASLFNNVNLYALTMFQ
mgnify:CR=1 FL=1